MAGGIDWFRWHHGSVTDPKFALVARKAAARLGDVIAVWAFVLEQASASSERGSVGDIDFESIDCMLGCEDGVTCRIVSAMRDRGLIDGARVGAWEKRQPKRERDGDSSTSRVQAFRDRQRQETHGNADEDDETPCNAKKHLEESREEKKEQEQKITPIGVVGGKAADPPEDPPAEKAKQADRLAQVTRDAVEVFNATLSKQAGGFLAAVTFPDSEKRRGQVKRAVKFIRSVCDRLYGSPTITREFWEDYFAECKLDPFRSGQGPYTNGHSNWLPDFEYLTRPEVIEKSVDDGLARAA
jgi:hypothetical protein